jgi:hypothetical protein
VFDIVDRDIRNRFAANRRHGAGGRSPGGGAGSRWEPIVKARRGVHDRLPQAGVNFLYMGSFFALREKGEER